MVLSVFVLSADKRIFLTAASKDEDKDKMGVGAIVGIILGVIALLAIIMVLVFVFVIRGRMPSPGNDHYIADQTVGVCEIIL